MRVSGVIRRTIGYTNDAFGLSQNRLVQNARTPSRDEIITDLAKQYAGVESDLAINKDTNPVAYKVARKAYNWAFNKIEAPEAYDFPTDRGKIQAFMEDVKEWIQSEILVPANFSELREGQHWTSEYVRNAYVKSAKVATGRLYQEGVSMENPERQDLLTRPVSVKTLQQLYTRTYENLRDITDDMAGVIREELTRGFAQGENPREIARRITKEVKTIQRTRAETLARTEVINAHTDAAFDTYERAGVDLVSHGEWQTAMDTDVCPFCRRLGSEVFRISEFRANHTVQFRDQIYRLNFPAHPNGRCAPLPVIGEPDELEPLSERVPGQLLT